MEEIITINGEQLRLETSAPLTQEQRNYVIRQISAQKTGCTSCGGNNNKIVSLAATCTRTTAIVEDVINLKARGTGGTAPYTAYFRKTGGNGSITPTSVSNLAENVDGSATYTVVAADAGTSITFAGYVVDSCAAGSITSESFSCPVTVQAAPVLTTITVAGCTSSISNNGTCQLTTTCTDQFGAAISCGTITWSSSNAAVASVSTTGLVTGYVVTSNTNVTITATGASGTPGTKVITVTPVSCTTPTCGFTIS